MSHHTKSHFLFSLWTVLCLVLPGQSVAAIISVPISDFGTFEITSYNLVNSGNTSGINILGGVKLNKPEEDICTGNNCFTGFRWIQMVVTNADNNTWSGSPPKIKDSGVNVGNSLWGEAVDDYMRDNYYIFLDPWNGSQYHDDAPFYVNNTSLLSGQGGYYYAFSDMPRRDGDGFWYNNTKKPLDWGAELALVGSNGNNISFLGSVKWGWERLNSNAYKDPASLSFSAVSDELKQMVNLQYPDYQVTDKAYCEIPEPSILILLAIGGLAGFGFRGARR